MLQHDISRSVVPGMIPVCRQDSSWGFDEDKTPADFFPSQRSFATEAFFTDSYVDLHICVPARRPETRAVRFPR